MSDFLHSWSFWLLVVLLVIGFAVRQAVNNVKRAAGNAINAVKNSPVTTEVAKGTVGYFLHRMFR